MSPTKIPSCPLPAAGALRRLVLWCGQSNAVGAQQTFLRQAQNIPHYYRSQTLHEGVSGYWDRLGVQFGDQFYPQAKFMGSQEQTGLDLTAAGKTPIFATSAKSGTSVTEFINGSAVNIKHNQVLADLVSQVGATGWNVPILWGEADALTLALSTAWQANLTTFVANLRTYLTNARIYLLQLNTNYVGNDVTWNGNVRTGNTNFVAGDSNAELLNWDAFSYATPHYLYAGYNSGGSNIATRVLAYQP